MKARLKRVLSGAGILVWLLPAILAMSCSKQPPLSLVPRTVDQDPTLPSIYVNGALFHAEAFGPADSSLVIVLHGGPGDDYRDLLNCKDLASSGYRVVFYDQRGTGLSQRFPRRFYDDVGAHVVDMMMDDLDSVVSHYRTKASQKVFLVGRSWGGMLASAYAGKYPARVNGMAVFEPGGLKWTDVKEYVKKSNPLDLSSEELNDKTYIDQFIAGKEDQHELLDYERAVQAANDHTTGEFNTTPGSFWRFGAVVSRAFMVIGKKYEPDFSTGLKQFTTPVLFCYSEKNLAYGESWAQKVASAYASVQLLKIPGTGHRGMIKDTAVWHQVTLPALLAYLNAH